MVYVFGNFNLLESKEIDNDNLIFIYLEEILFNFVIFYNLILKSNNEEHFEP